MRQGLRAVPAGRAARSVGLALTDAGLPPGSAEGSNGGNGANGGLGQPGGTGGTGGSGSASGAEADCSLVSPGFGFDYPPPTCDLGWPRGASFLVGDSGVTRARYECTGITADVPVVKLGDVFVDDPFECHVVGDQHDTGVMCPNLYYGSGFDVRHGTYQLFDAHAPSGLDACRAGFVWREARADPVDHVCVTPGSKALTQQENAEADGSCKESFVVRAAFPRDGVCVSPARRDEAHADDLAAATRRNPVSW